MASRTIPPSAFSGDDGSPDPRLQEALAVAAADPARRPEVLAALHDVRVLVPVTAEGTASGSGARGLRVDTEADIAVPLLEGEDGRRALPVFSGLDALARWDQLARPVAVLGGRAAEVALAESAEVLVVDLSGPASCVLGRPEVWALAEGRGRVPAYADPATAAAVEAVVSADPSVARAWLEPARDVDARVVVVPADPGPGAAEAAVALLERVAAGLRAQPGWAATAVRGVDLALAHPDAPPPDA